MGWLIANPGVSDVTNSNHAVDLFIMPSSAPRRVSIFRIMSALSAVIVSNAMTMEATGGWNTVVACIVYISVRIMGCPYS